MVITLAENQPPTLTVSSPASVVAGNTITIRASATDPDGDTLSFTINGVAGSIYSTQAQSVSAGSNVSFDVSVTDGINTVTDTVSVSVTAPAASSSGGGGGSMGLYILLLVPAIWLRRFKK